MIEKNEIINKTAESIIWWLRERKKKLRDHLAETMSINPFLLPVLFELHNTIKFEELNDLLIASHLMIGHNTGFGKLIDEKILPNVFGTQKLDAKFREANPPYHQSCFDEVDHLVVRGNNMFDLLSLKSGKWTIQLTMAVQLNLAFNEIIEKYNGNFNEIAVGVIYGKAEGLTDKYDILRGINRGKNHNVIDLTSHVNVYAGCDFWAWLNNGEKMTQYWILEGIKLGLRNDNSRKECGNLLSRFRDKIVANYSQYTTSGSIDWERLLKDING